MSILTAHELGHYFAARHYRVPVSLPYFIPFPSLFGTMGAVIRMSPLIPNRTALLDIAAAGPIAGIVLAIPMTFVGVMLSVRVPLADQSPSIMLGDPLLLQAFERLLHGPPDETMVLLISDVGFAGWVGLFVTALNLLPIGQLDGGHVSYAVLESRSVHLARAAVVAMAAICLLISPNFVIMLILLVFVMGIRHRPTANDTLPLPRSRFWVALLLVVLFAVCFTPVPVSIDL